MDYAKLFKALSNQNRLDIISILDETPMCACKIIEQLNISQSTLSHHMKILETNNLVNVKKQGKWKHYSINMKTFKNLQLFFDAFEGKQAGGVCQC